MKNLNARILSKGTEISVDNLIWAIENCNDFFIYEIDERNILIEIINKDQKVKLNKNLALNEIKVNDLISVIDNCDNLAIWKSKDNKNNFIVEVF